MITEVAKITRVREQDILGDSRWQDIVDIRHVYWFLLFREGFTWSQIGRICDRNHATIIYGVRRVEGLLAVGDKEMNRIYEQLKHIKR